MGSWETALAVVKDQKQEEEEEEEGGRRHHLRLYPLWLAREREGHEDSPSGCKLSDFGGNLDDSPQLSSSERLYNGVASSEGFRDVVYGIVILIA
jgi:hypothetical protein